MRTREHEYFESTVSTIQIPIFKHFIIEILFQSDANFNRIVEKCLHTLARKHFNQLKESNNQKMIFVDDIIQSVSRRITFERIWGRM